MLQMLSLPCKSMVYFFGLTFLAYNSAASMLEAHAPKIVQVEQALHWWLLFRRGEKVTMNRWQVLVISPNISEDLRRYRPKGGGGTLREWVLLTNQTGY